MCLFFAAIAHKQLFVSPKIKKASGLISSSNGSILIKIVPIVSIELLPAAFKK